MSTCSISKPSSLRHDGGIRVGRIVKASYKGMAIKTYELIMQIGNVGNQFKSMSVKSSKMFDCAVAALRSGKKMRVYYVDSVFSGLSGTVHNVYKIEAPDDL